MTHRYIRAQKALPFLSFIFFLFALVILWCFFILNHNSYLHQLNMRHSKFTEELSLIVSAPLKPVSIPSNVNIELIREAIINVRNQPVECLATINFTDRQLLKFIGTEAVFELCESDIISANDALDSLKLYEKGEINIETLQNQLLKSLSEFRHNSVKFENPVEKTSNFIANSTIWLILLSSAIILLFAMYLSNLVSKVLTHKEEAIKALAASEERNKQLAYIDTLTGLPNRNILERTINSAIARSNRNDSLFALMFIDLDQFKDVNDTLGHTAGDKLLVEVANRISHALRNNDSIVRFGGDEFVAVTDCYESIETIHDIASRIIETISPTIKLIDSDIYITASIGIACYPENGLDTTSLLKHADAAMYQAKNAGKNQYQIYDKLSASIQKRKLKLVKQLHQAISKDEFSLVYQPIVKLSNGNTVGSEALLRWTTSEGEVIGPDEFIPIAEKSGQIIEIGNWVLQQACQQCKNWQEAGAPHHTMAINVSSHQLKDPQFATELKAILNNISLSAESIHIEVTENIAITEDQTCVANLHKLSELGTQLLLDDFGTGYSCLSYLKNLPFDVLKIDKSFMPANNTIASTIIAMGHELNMEIIAEGIETEMCFMFLKNLNCHYGQGYLFQKPVSPNEFDIFKQFV